MICFEIKKIFSKTISRISLIVLLFSLVISCYFAITNITYIDNRGVSHTGIAAARNLRKEKQRWEGVLDKAALQAVIDEYRKVNEEYPIRQGDYTANLLHDSKVQGFSEIKDMINMGFCEFRDFNYYRIDSVSKDEVGKLYENREKSLEKWLQPVTGICQGNQHGRKRFRSDLFFRNIRIQILMFFCIAHINHIIFIKIRRFDPHIR